MKLFKNYVILTQKELTERAKEQYDDGKETGMKSSKIRIEGLEAGIERKDKSLQKVQIELAEAREAIEVHEEMRDKSRDLVMQRIKNDDAAALLDARKDTLDEREARVKDLESRLETKTDSAYKGAYADGAADMARKIGDITQADRDNAMKIAMVSAASHTNVDTMKEINSEYRLTEGTSNKKS